MLTWLIAFKVLVIEQAEPGKTGKTKLLSCCTAQNDLVNS